MGENLDFGIIWRQNGLRLQIKIFREKSGRVTFFILLCPNFVQKNRKIQCAVFHNFWWQTEPEPYFWQKNLKKPNFQIFFRKSGRVTFFILFFTNFVQKSRQIVRWEITELLKLTDPHNICDIIGF